MPFCVSNGSDCPHASIAAPLELCPLLGYAVVSVAEHDDQTVVPVSDMDIVVPLSSLHPIIVDN
jgi:hypothetical protein